MDSRLIELTQASSILPPLQRLPLEIITQIVKHLSLRDILSLASVSKIWRCVYLNQNIIWKEVCLNLNIREEDYMSCVLDTARNSHKCTRYVDAYSTKLFGPTCRWWLLYNLYNQVLRNILHNDFPIFHIPRDQVEQSYCTDDYIVNLHRQYCIRIELVLLNDMPTEKINLKLFDQFKELYGNKNYSLNVVGNKKFLVFEIRSVIFVYEIVYGEFIPRFWKTIRKSIDYNPRKVKMLPDIQFFEDKHNTKIDISEDKFALIHPFDNTVFVIDLPSQSIFKELVYSSKLCVVDCMKCAEDRLMIGISSRDDENHLITEHSGIVYHFDESSDDNKFTVPLFGAATQFKITNNYIGIENKAAATPFITKITKLIHIFWLDCDTFSFDCTRKFIYYNVNKSIFKYDLKKSRIDRFEVTQKIAIDAVSDSFSLTPINDRFLLVRSNIPNSYEIFDVKQHFSVRSIILTPGYRLVHVGKLCVMFCNHHEFLIVSFR